MQAAALAFDRAAATYDEGFGRNPAGLLFRHVYQERLRRLLPQGARVLDVGCGTGEDALFLAGLGVRVHAIDPARAMIERARAKADALEVPRERLRFEVLRAEDVARAGRGFDGACSDMGALNCAELGAVGRGLAAALRPGAPLLVSLMGPWPLPVLVERALRGRGESRRRSRPRVAGMPVPASYPSSREVRDLFGPAFEWRSGCALGVLVPGPGHAGWAQRNPQAFGLLAALEGIVRRWPLVRELGDHLVLEGARR
jgi:SAM-dependent methyltransferase